MRKLVLILVLLFGISSVSFAMGSAPSAQVEEAQFVPRPLIENREIRIPNPAIKVQTIAYDDFAYSNPTPINSARVLVVRVSRDMVQADEKYTAGEGGDAGIATFTSLVEGRQYTFYAFKQNYLPRSVPNVTIGREPGTYSGGVHVMLPLIKINYFTDEMKRDQRLAKLRIVDRADRTAILRPEVYITRQIDNGVYGITITTPLSPVGKAVSPVGKAVGIIQAYLPFADGYQVAIYKSGYEPFTFNISPENLFGSEAYEVVIKRFTAP
jgi:hypothetical protein